MTSGKPRALMHLAVALLVTLAAGTALAASSPWTVPMLLKTLAGAANRKARFTEVNHLASLRRAVRVYGTLQYIKPDTLIMTEGAPRKAIYRIVGGRLFVNRARRGVSVGRYPSVIAMVSGFEGLLSGNYALLTHDFTTRLQGNRKAWRLLLRPRLAALKKALISVAITGHGTQLTQITTRAPNGDSSDMYILP